MFLRWPQTASASALYHRSTLRASLAGCNCEGGKRGEEGRTGELFACPACCETGIMDDCPQYQWPPRWRGSKSCMGRETSKSADYIGRFVTWTCMTDELRNHPRLHQSDRPASRSRDHGLKRIYSIRLQSTWRHEPYQLISV